MTHLRADFTGIGVAPTVAAVVVLAPDRIVVTYSEPVAAHAAGLYTLTPFGGAAARVVSSIILAGAVVTLRLDGPMTPGTDNYDLTVSASVTDVVGNGLAAPYVFMLSGPSVVVGIGDHCAQALDRLVAQYRDKPKIAGLICAFLDPLQDLELVCAQILAGRDLDSAIGAQLDMIGDFLGLAREGLADAVYRTRLVARGMVIGSTGMPEDLRAILTTLLGAGPVRLREEPPGATVLFAPDPLLISDAEAYARILRDAAPAATRVLFEYDPITDAPFFVFAEYGEDPTDATPLLEWGEDPGDGHAFSEGLDGWYGGTE